MTRNSEEYLEFIKSRRSIRKFKDTKIDKEKITSILECARWAPSGLNNQPWKVFIVEYPTIKTLLAECTKYSSIIENAPVNFVIFLDMEKSYDRVKDIQGMGAFIQTMLLSIHAFGLGAVWLGEILNRKMEVNELFKLDPDKFELMGVIAMGEIADIKENEEIQKRERKSIQEFAEFI